MEVVKLTGGPGPLLWRSPACGSAALCVLAEIRTVHLCPPQAASILEAMGVEVVRFSAQQKCGFLGSAWVEILGLRASVLSPPGVPQ